MNKLFTKIAAAGLSLAMAVGVGVAVGSNAKQAKQVHAASAQWQLVTSAPSDWSGEYILANGTSGTVKMLDGSSFSSSSVAGVDVTVSSSKITADTADALTIAKSSTSGKYTVKVNGKYIGKNANSNGIDANATWSSNLDNEITYSSSKVFIKGNGGRVLTWYASNSNFRYYASSNNNSQLYKKVESKTLSSISVQTAPTKTTYYAGDYFDPTGLVITRNYSDSTSDTYTYAGHTSDFTFSPSTSTALTQSNTSVTITHGGKSTTQAITVNPARTLSSIAVQTAPTKTAYVEDECFDPTGLVITRTYSDSSSDTYAYANHTSEFSFNPSTSTALTTSDTSVTITYSGKSTTQAITVKEAIKYELITSESGLVSGCNYLIGAYASDTYRFMSTTQNGNNRGHHVLTGTVTNNQVAYEQGMEVVTLGGSSNNGWTLYANNSETAGYLYLPSNNNYLRTRESSFNWGISFSNEVPSISATVTNERFIKYNSSNNPPIFSCYQSGQTNISLWKEVSTAESIAISKDSVSGLKGDTDSTVSITASNFTPTNIEVSYSTSGVASVTKGTISEGVIPLNVSYTGVGDTTATITVKGGSQDYSVDLDISVAAKPASMTIVHSDIVAGHLEIKTGAYKQVSFSGLDTDGNPYSIAAADVTPSVQSGSAYVELSGSRITGLLEGTAVVRYTLKALSSVYAELTVDVADDYKTTVNSITFNSNLSDTQGDGVDTSAVFATKLANTHFGSTETILDSELLFSYEDNRSGAETIDVFTYDFSHGTTVDSTHKSQTVYVFTTFDTSYSGNFTITIEQKNDPLTAITITNVVNNEKEMARGTSFQLEIAYTPEHPTDGKEVVYRVDENDEGVSVGVNATGLITVSASSGLGTVLIVVESAHDETIFDWVEVTVTLESMTYIVSEDESWTKVTDDSSLKAGDVILVASESKGKVLGSFSGTNKYADEGTATFSSGTASDISGALEFTLEEGSSSGTWNLKNGTKYLYGTSSKTTLCLSDTASDVTITISSGNATIDFGSGCRILHNVNSTRFSNYTSATSSTMLLPQIYVKSGGDVEMTVTADLFNAVHNNFGPGKTYEWSESCPAFEDGDWADACEAVLDIQDYDDYKLNIAVANASGNEIEQFLAKYDAIITKFGTDYDYLERFAVGGINYGVTAGQHISIINSDNVAAIIVIVSLVSITAIGGYFAIRKRKEQ